MTEATQQRIANYHAILDVADTLIARWFDSAANAPATTTPTPAPPDPAPLASMVLTLRRVIDTRHRLDNWDKPAKTPKTRYPLGLDLDREWTDEEEEADTQAILKLMEVDWLDSDGNEYPDADECDEEESQDDVEHEVAAPSDQSPAPGNTATTPDHPPTPPTSQSAIQPAAPCQKAYPEFHSTPTASCTPSTPSTSPTPSTPLTPPTTSPARPPPTIT